MDAATQAKRILRLGSFAISLMITSTAQSATYKTQNFEVHAQTADAAKKIGEHAEKCRMAIARAWLGKELPAWKKRCPLRVKLTAGEAGGVTTFDFSPQGGVLGQTMSVEGRIDRILDSALPHEITHTIFAAYLGKPMPRWADEGALLLSEDQRELSRHDRIVSDLVHKKRQFTLASLFRMEDYPRDLMGFYGQGYSVSRFLVELGGRKRFLAFVREGMRESWDDAARIHYGLADLTELERAWNAWRQISEEEPSRLDKPTSPLVVMAVAPIELAESEAEPIRSGDD